MRYDMNFYLNWYRNYERSKLKTITHLKALISVKLGLLRAKAWLHFFYVSEPPVNRHLAI